MVAKKIFLNPQKLALFLDNTICKLKRRIFLKNCLFIMVENTPETGTIFQTVSNTLHMEQH